jgi:NAD(P)-dependent dehydrogenase (short-subunit alcohol dehydrogenase family)
VEASRVFVDGALEGRVAIVTGGGTNLGKAAAAELARCGAQVVIAGRRPEVLEAAAAELGARCSWVAGDIRERAGAEEIVSTALGRFGRVDVVLNNAGGQYMVPAESLATKGWRAVQRLNVDGTLAMCKAAYELAMRDAGGGTIINVTVSPHHGMPAMPTPVRPERRSRRSRVSSPPPTACTASRSSPLPSAASTPSRCASTRASCGAAPPPASRRNASAASRSTAG